ncbi:PDC sensor domain-containing protein [Paenibacillus kribbensis]|uniref:PDC sensor domain-containing protein n=1 Tax=Paenibacillus kribbensis TaxID=172713 RepID=UPI0015BEE4AD|nr:PDC sensor domain-containing protein [Paenibacillus kribbensis]
MVDDKWFHGAVTKLRNMRLQNKLLMGYLVACVIPFLIVSAFIYHQAAAELEDSSQEFAALYTSQLETTLNQFMEEYDRVTKSVLVDNDIINKLGDTRSQPIDEQALQRLTIQRLLMRVAILRPEIGNLMLISEDNSVYQYSNTTSMVNEASLLSQEWYRRLRSSNEKLFITGLHDRSYYEDRGDGALITVGRVLLGSDGAFRGVILIDLDPFNLLELNQDFVSARDKYGMSVTVSNALGETIYHSDAASGRVTWKQVLESDIDYTKDTSSKDLIILSGSTRLGQLIIKTQIPREKDPLNPMLTSSDHSELVLQKAGHASLVETQNGEWYLAHLCGRPTAELRCTLGRETALQHCFWDDNGWLRIEGGAIVLQSMSRLRYFPLIHLRLNRRRMILMNPRCVCNGVRSVSLRIPTG